jgi:hypothetical protein
MQESDLFSLKRNLILTVLFVVAITTASQLQAQHAPPKEPTYHTLRYEEDFSYLDGPEDSYLQDIWNPIKWIAIGDDWHLTLGGQARLRFESETDKDFGVSSPSHDAFLLQRYLIHTDFRHVSGMRFFFQGKFAYSNDRDKGGEDTLENYADFHQAFMDLPLGETVWRLGRQELQYGNQRLISPLDWGNLRRSFDGIKVSADLSDWRIDAFAVRPVVNDIKDLDSWDQDRDFYARQIQTVKQAGKRSIPLAAAFMGNRVTGIMKLSSGPSSVRMRETAFVHGWRLRGADIFSPRPICNPKSGCSMTMPVATVTQRMEHTAPSISCFRLDTPILDTLTEWGVRTSMRSRHN